MTKMIDSSEYYGGTYPDEPNFEEIEKFEEDYEEYIADIMYEEMKLKEE